MGSGNANDAWRNRRIDRRSEHGFPTPLLELDLLALGHAELVQQRTMHPRFGWSRIGSLLEGHRTTHQRIGEINRDIGHSLEGRRRRSRRSDLDFDRIGKALIKRTGMSESRLGGDAAVRVAARTGANGLLGL